MQPGLFFPLYHTNKAVKDFNVLLTLAVYDRAFSDLDVVNQFLNDFPVKLLHIQIAADDTGPLPVDLCQYFGHKKLKVHADFFNSSSSFCWGVI